MSLCRVMVLVCMLLFLMAGLRSDAATTDTGDPVYFTGPNEIDAGSLKVGGVPVSVAGASGSEFAAANLATTGNITLSGEQTVDGVLTAGSTVVVWLQTNGVQNGFYLSSTGSWARRTDLDVSAEFAGNKAVYVQSGTRYAGTVFRVANTGTVTVGSTAISLIPEPAQWHVSGLQILTNGGTISCASPAGQYVGVSTTVVGSGGPVDLGSPRIVPGTRTNQLCRIKGTSDTETVEIADGSGVLLAQEASSVLLSSRTTLTVEWSGTVWRQIDGSGGGGGNPPMTLQDACDTGATCGWTNLTQARPLTFRGSPIGPYELLYELGGDLIRGRFNADGSNAPPESVRLHPDNTLSIQALLGTPTPSWQDVATITNEGGAAITTTGLFAATQNHIEASIDVHEASAITFTPTSLLTAGNVQEAIVQLRTQTASAVMGACGLSTNPIFSDGAGTSLELCVASGTPVLAPTCAGTVCGKMLATNLILRSDGEKPTCNAAYATAQTLPLWVTNTGLPGQATTLQVCSKNAADVYAWRSIALP